MDLVKPASLKKLLEACPELPHSVLDKIPSGTTVNSIDSPEYSGEHSLTFISGNTPAGLVRNLKCAFLFYEGDAGAGMGPGAGVDNVYALINLILENCASLFRGWSREGLSETAPGTDTILGDVDSRAEVNPGCYVGRGSIIRAGCRLEPGVTVLENCLLEENVLVQSGAVIGTQGFGFYNRDGEKIPVRHGAGVHIEKNCWIGAQTVVAAGVLNPTFIGHSSKIDSHVQIAHNVRLDHHAVIASQSGIAGSTRIGHHLLMGGASSIAGHLVIEPHVTVAARTGVTKNIRQGMTIAGFPAQPINRWKKQQAHLRKFQ